jgi:hypothetical protein
VGREFLQVFLRTGSPCLFVMASKKNAARICQPKFTPYWTEERRSKHASETKAGMRAKLEERTSEKVAADISLKELRNRLAQTQGFDDTASEIKAGMRSKLEERTGDKVAADISGKELQDRLARTQGFADKA